MWQFLGPKRHKELSILDIALVTTLDVPSNMGLEGKPSAVMRAFRGTPHGTIIGADVDQRVLFKEQRIEIFFRRDTLRATRPPGGRPKMQPDHR